LWSRYGAPGKRFTGFADPHFQLPLRPRVEQATTAATGATLSIHFQIAPSTLTTFPQIISLTSSWIFH